MPWFTPQPPSFAVFPLCCSDFRSRVSVVVFGVCLPPLLAWSRWCDLCVCVWIVCARYGANKFPEPPFAGFWALFFESFQDPVLLILVAAAVVSLAVGLAEHPESGWIDGVSIVIAILLVAFVGAGNNYNKELQFRALRSDADDMVKIRVLRCGDNAFVGTKEIVVGDVVHLETGDKIVADGIFISGSSVKTEEGAITGESDNVSKDAVRDPFLISGTSVAAGTCDMLVTSVGIRSMQGRIMADTATEAKDTPLQEKLEDMAKKIGYLGFGSSFATFIAMIISWFADNSNLTAEYPAFKVRRAFCG
jgi:P-type Ca2+ transporter type 2C